MRLTKNFTLDEFLRSQTATRRGIDMTPPQYVIDNLQDLCVTVLQPLRDATNSRIRISSGYRPPELNRIINGSKTSAHMDGRAADFTVEGETPFETASMLDQMGVVADQIILEFDQWVHVGISDQPRQQLLTAYRADGVVHYSPGHIRDTRNV